MSKIKAIIKKIYEKTKEKDIIPIEKVVDKHKILDNKVALIAGGSGGIGMAIADALLASGCKVILGGTKPQKLKNCKEHFTSKYQASIETAIINLNDINDFNEKINILSKIWGKIDIFVNSAGVHTENVDFWAMTPKEYDRVMDINLKGPYFACLAMAKYWKKNKLKGHILLISSSRGSEPAFSPYGISKWGINGMTKGLAEVLINDNIIVNAIAPGSTATPLLGIYSKNDSIYTVDNKFDRMVVPDEIGEYARMLVSDAGDMVVGEVIHISGGRGVFDIR